MKTNHLRVFLLTALMCLLGSNKTFAQSNPKFIGNRFYATIPEFSYHEKATLYSREYDWKNNKVTFYLYDDNFDVKKTMTMNNVMELFYYDYDIFFGASDAADWNLTQTLFNDDEAYEFITLTNDDKGFSIVSEDGSVLKTIAFEEGFSFTSKSMLFILNGEIYLGFEGDMGEERDYGFLIYHIDRQTEGGQPSAIRKVAMHVGITPSVVGRSENMTVDIEGEDVKELLFVNSAGQTVKRVPVEKGQKSVTVSSNGLNPGMNIVNAVGRRGHAARKFIVK